MFKSWQFYFHNIYYTTLSSLSHLQSHNLGLQPLSPGVLLKCSNHLLGQGLLPHSYLAHGQIVLFLVQTWSCLLKILFVLKTVLKHRKLCILFLIMGSWIISIFPCHPCLCWCKIALCTYYILDPISLTRYQVGCNTCNKEDSWHYWLFQP